VAGCALIFGASCPPPDIPDGGLQDGSDSRPAAPVSLHARARTVSSIALTWSDTATNETGFKIERGSSITGPWLEIATPGANTTSFDDAGLSPATAYCYRVRATNPVGDSDFSNVVSAKTPAADGVTGVVVIPRLVTLPAGQTRQLNARVVFVDGTSKDVTSQAAWTSSGPDDVTVSRTGLVAPAAGGAVGSSAVVTARFGGESGGSTVRLVPEVAEVAVAPASASLPLDRSVQLVATARFRNGTAGDVTPEALWTSSAPANVTVNGTGMAAPASGGAPGERAAITAEFGGLSGSSSITLTLARPAIGLTTGNDPLLAQQWHLRNTGQTGYADVGGVAGQDIDAAYTYLGGFRGTGVKVAVVDSGLEILHEDLAPNVAPGSWNFVTGTADPTSGVIDGDHGTSVAGLIAAAYGNGAGGMGVAPGASLNGYNLISSSQVNAYYVASLGGSTARPNSSDVWIFNQSFGSDNAVDIAAEPVVVAQYLSGVTSLRGGRGALYVKSAGNGFKSFGTIPSCDGATTIGVSCQNASMDPLNALPYNVVIGALNANGVRSSYSTAGSALWVSAPGGEYGANAGIFPDLIPEAYQPGMVTTDQSGCDHGYSPTGDPVSFFNKGSAPNSSCDYTNTMNGTSSAAPVTSGVVALVLEANPTLTWRDVKHVLASTATRVDGGLPAVLDASVAGGPYVAELPWTTNAAGYAFHNWYGFGRINADDAVRMAKNYAYGQLGTFVDTGWISSGSIWVAIPDNDAAGASSSIEVSNDLVIESVQISVSCGHSWTGDLGIELTSPSGTKSILLNIKNGFHSMYGLEDMVLLSNSFYGETSKGSWTLKVVDGWGSDSGILTNWKIRIFGH